MRNTRNKNIEPSDEGQKTKQRGNSEEDLDNSEYVAVEISEVNPDGTDWSEIDADPSQFDFELETTCFKTNTNSFFNEFVSLLRQYISQTGNGNMSSHKGLQAGSVA